MQYVTEVTNYWTEADKNDYKNIDSFPHEVFSDMHPNDVDWNDAYPYYKIAGIHDKPPIPGKAPPVYKDPVAFDGDLNEIETDDLINNNIIRFDIHDQQYAGDSDVTYNSASPPKDKNNNKNKKSTSKTGPAAQQEHTNSTEQNQNNQLQTELGSVVI